MKNRQVDCVGPADCEGSDARHAVFETNVFQGLNVILLPQLSSDEGNAVRDTLPTIVIRIEHIAGASITLDDVSKYTTTTELIQTAIRRLLFRQVDGGWCLLRNGAKLAEGVELHRYIHESNRGSVELLLIAVEKALDCSEATPFPLGAPPPTDESELEEAPDLTELHCEATGVRFSLRSRTDIGEPDSVEPSMPATPALRAITTRANVRYYSRMNPDRLFPLLVVFTKDLLEDLRRSDVSQASASLRFLATAPLEVEPILPGCDCYPRRALVRNAGKEDTLRFHVVPRILGAIEGAVVVIRQHDSALAEIRLVTKVVPRTWVRLSAVATFVLPAFSAILKHYGVDFETQSQQGFSVYVSAAHMMFGALSPVTLTILLAFATAAIWTKTRPKAKDTFWDIHTILPDDQLRRIAVLMESDPSSASTQLMELLSTHPKHQNAWLFYAEWHFNSGDYTAALEGYQTALELDPIEERDYRRAAAAAAALGHLDMAIELLSDAEQKLPPEKITAVLLYNAGCYFARAGQPLQALEYLHRAATAGFREKSKYETDPDLDSLRENGEFRELVSNL